jgi:hypothetical protein
MAKRDDYLLCPRKVSLPGGLTEAEGTKPNQLIDARELPTIGYFSSRPQSPLPDV